MFPGLQEFKEKMVDGGPRSSLFRMSITWPIAVPIGNAFGAPEIPWACHVSEIPGSEVNSFTVKYAGREIKFAGQRTYQNLSVSVYNSNNFKLRKALEAWHDAINTRDTNIATLLSPTGDPTKGYAGTGKVDQYDQQGNIVRSYVFVDLWPTRISSIALDWSQDASLESYTVDFAYQHWVPGEEYAGSAIRSALTA